MSPETQFHSIVMPLASFICCTMGFSLLSGDSSLTPAKILKLVCFSPSSGVDAVLLSAALPSELELPPWLLEPELELSPPVHAVRPATRTRTSVSAVSLFQMSFMIFPPFIKYLF